MLDKVGRCICENPRDYRRVSRKQCCSHNISSQRTTVVAQRDVAQRSESAQVARSLKYRNSLTWRDTTFDAKRYVATEI
jgi:hypothetical protein